MQIPSFREGDEWGAGRTLQQEKDPPPEKYSIEWYEQQAELSRKRALQPEAEQPLLPLVAAVVVLGGTFAALAAK